MNKSIRVSLSEIVLAGIFAVFAYPLSGQAEPMEAQPQFLFKDFHDSRILLKSGKIQNSKMNYNTITETMVFISDNNIYDLANPGMVDTVYILDRKFIPAGKAFYEFLKGGDLTLYCQVKSDLKPVGKDAGYGTKSHTVAITTYSSITSSGTNYNLKLPPDYTIDTRYIYWIDKTDSFETERQFLKLFPEESDALKAHIKRNRLKFDNQEHVIEIVRYCSGIISGKSK